MDFLLEVAALQAVHGPRFVSLDEECIQQLVDLAASGELEDEVAVAQLACQRVDVTLRCRAPVTSAWDPDVDGVDPCSGAGSGAGAGPSTPGSGHSGWEVELRVRLPPGYPTPQRPPAPTPALSDSTDPALQGAPAESAARGSCGVRCSASAAACASAAGGAAGGAAAAAASPGGGGGGGLRPPGREWCDRVAAGAEEQASAAVAEARPCLTELLEYLHSEAAAQVATAAAAACATGGRRGEERGQRGRAGTATSAEAEAEAEAQRQRRCGGATSPSMAPACSSGRDAEPAAESEQGLQVLLLRLDHMHNRGLYCRTVASWVRELGITGRLIFSGGLILILLEGDAEALRMYLVRHRTESVDVDSRGRKCKERMMSVVGQKPCRPSQQQQQGQHHQQQQHQQHKQQHLPQSSQPPRATGGAGQGLAASRRAFSDFREVQCGSLEEVGCLLAQAGAGEWLRPAAGLAG